MATKKRAKKAPVVPEIPVDELRERLVVGCDQSLTHTALHLHNERLAITSKCSDSEDVLRRLISIREQFCEVLRLQYSGLLFIEGLAFGSHTTYSREIAGLGFALRMDAYELGWIVVDVPPATLKKYVTGKGNTQKDGVRMHLMKKPWQYESLDNNDADAFALRALGLEWQRWKLTGEATKTKAELFGKLAPMVPHSLPVTS